MADLVIRGMKMPTHCLRDCPVCDCERMVCKADTFARPVDWTTDTVPEWCPLLPLPAGHGRLIDGDALFEKMYRLSDNEGAHKDSRVDDALILRDSACYLIEDAPTIVPAEGGTE